jgi:hypothetical protein
MTCRETGGFFVARLSSKFIVIGGNAYDSETKLKTVGKGKKTRPQKVLQLRGQQLPFAGRRRALPLCAVNLSLWD